MYRDKEELPHSTWKRRKSFSSPRQRYQDISDSLPEVECYSPCKWDIYSGPHGKAAFLTHGHEPLTLQMLSLQSLLWFCNRWWRVSIIEHPRLLRVWGKKDPTRGTTQQMATFELIHPTWGEEELLKSPAWILWCILLNAFKHIMTEHNGAGVASFTQSKFPQDTGI